MILRFSNPWRREPGNPPDFRDFPGVLRYPEFSETHYEALRFATETLKSAVQEREYRVHLVTLLLSRMLFCLFVVTYIVIVWWFTSCRQVVQEGLELFCSTKLLLLLEVWCGAGFESTNWSTGTWFDITIQFLISKVWFWGSLWFYDHRFSAWSVKDSWYPCMEWRSGGKRYRRDLVRLSQRSGQSRSSKNYQKNKKEER